MRTEGKGLNFVFFDLSKLDTSSASAFLVDRFLRPGSSPIPEGAVCHWIVSGSRGKDLLDAPGEGSTFLRERLESGDRLFATNPSGFDWNHLFPGEAERELDVMDALSPLPVLPFLENTPQCPPWLGSVDRRVFRASASGLCFLRDGAEVCLPWAKGPESTGGVWWLVPGQALFSTFPLRPWSDLVSIPLGKAFAQSLPIPPKVPSPVEKLAAYAVGVHRRTQNSPLHQAILFRSQEFPGLGTKEAVDFEETLGGIRKRSLVANMQGQTDLTEAGLKVRFLGGRLIRIENAQGVFCTGAESYLEWNGTRRPFVVNSAFSFEGDYSWGLRQSLLLSHEDLQEPGRAILDFYFVEESREFFVAATVRWPRWKTPVTVNRWAPLELSLFDGTWADSLTSRVTWPDGRAADQVHRKAKAGTLTGTDFLLASGKRALVLGFPQNQTSRPHVLPWRRVARWGRSRLVVWPEGGEGPRPSADFEGIEEHFTFYLTPADGAKLPFSVTRKQAVELIPPFVTELQP